MIRRLPILALTAFTLAAQAPDRARLAAMLSFEAEPVNGRPGGWYPSPPTDVFSDEQVVHGGKRSVRLERREGSAGPFSGINYAIPVDFAGHMIQFRGFIRTENVSNFVALWMREDGDGRQSFNLAFDTLQGRQIKGTTDWTEYSISVPVHQDARQLYVGFLLSGTGKAWADDLELLVDGKPVWDAPKPVTVLDTDHEFDAGSKVAFTQLTAAQIDNLATLGKVWGFLKYHHPAIAAGRHHWDYDLFRILPEILKAADRSAANTALATWIDTLGEVPACSKCAVLPTEGLYLKPDLDWIRDEAVLGAGLSRALQAIYRNRVTGKQFYIAQIQNVGNPVFDHEPAYAAVTLPDPGYQLLGLFRYWNMVQYWFPNRDIIGEDWSKLLTEYVPKIALAKTSDDYKRQVLTLIARVHDTHANLWSSLDVRPPSGACRLPVLVRFVDDRAVVAGPVDPASPAQPQLNRGDIIDAIDGVAVADLVKQWEPYYAASNRAAALRDMAGNLTNGPCGEVKLRIRRGAETLDLAAVRIAGGGARERLPHDITGDAFRLLSKDVAYIKISTVKSADAAKHIDAAAGTKGLVIDIRNYPGDFPIFALGGLLVEKETPFARFTRGDLTNPGAFVFDPNPTSLRPLKPHYAGKVVILVDEVSQSSAEYHAMAFRSVPNAKVLGSTTAGADGNVSAISLPGGLRTMFSGIGVFYPDKRPTQGIGIVPDREVKPTVAGIRDGRDEVLEAALREILGPGVPAAEIETLARHN